MYIYTLVLIIDTLVKYQMVSVITNLNVYGVTYEIRPAQGEQFCVGIERFSDRHWPKKEKKKNGSIVKIINDMEYCKIDCK